MSCDVNSVSALVHYSLKFGMVDRQWVGLIPRARLQMGKQGPFVICVRLLLPSGLFENSFVLVINVELLLFGI